MEHLGAPVNDFEWGFISKTQTASLGTLSTEPEKYAILRDFSNFNQRINSTKTLIERDIVKVEFKQRILALLCVAILYGKWEYYEDARNLTKDSSYQSLLPSSEILRAYMDIIHEIDFSKENLKSRFEKRLALWKRCPGFVSEVKNSIGGNDLSFFENSSSWFSQTFLFSAPSIFWVVKKTEAAFLLWYEALIYDYGFLPAEKMTQLGNLTSPGQPKKYRLLLKLSPLKKSFGKSQRHLVLYQISRRIIGLIGASIICKSDAYIKAAHSMFKIAGKKISPEEMKCLETSKAQLQEANNIHQNTKRFNCLQEWPNLKHKIEMLKELKEYLEKKGIDFSLFENNELDTVLLRFHLIENVNLLFNQWVEESWETASRRETTRAFFQQKATQFKPDNNRAKRHKSLTFSGKRQRSSSLNTNSSSISSTKTDAKKSDPSSKVTEELMIKLHYLQRTSSNSSPKSSDSSLASRGKSDSGSITDDSTQKTDFSDSEISPKEEPKNDKEKKDPTDQSAQEEKGVSSFVDDQDPPSVLYGSLLSASPYEVVDRVTGKVYYLSGGIDSKIVHTPHFDNYDAEYDYEGTGEDLTDGWFYFSCNGKKPKTTPVKEGLRLFNPRDTLLINPNSFKELPITNQKDEKED